MAKQRLFESRQLGFGLVEIMVGLAIGLLGVLVIMQVSVVFEERKRTTATGADAQTNGAIAFNTIDRDVRRAGYGLGVAGALGCQIRRSFENSAATPPLILSPVTITNGADGLPDTIRILASSKNGYTVPSRVTRYHSPSAANVFLDTTLGIEQDDLMVLFEPGKHCVMFQVSDVPNGNVQVHHRSSEGMNWNPPGGLAAEILYPQSPPYATAGYGVGAKAFNLGTLVDHTYSVEGSGDLTLTDYDSADHTFPTRIISSDIVNLQAQYGFDMRNGTPTDARVTRWSSTMLDVNGNGVVGDNGDLTRIYAVRMAIVARSSQREKANPATGECDITIADEDDPSRARNVPTWTAADDEGNLVSTDLRIDMDPDWACYRYKVFESIIPLKNMLWREL